MPLFLSLERFSVELLQCVGHLRFFQNTVKSGFGVPLAVEQKRIAPWTPRILVSQAPKSHEFDVFFVFHEHTKEAGVLIGEFLVGCADHATATGLGVLGNIRALVALAVALHGEIERTLVGIGRGLKLPVLAEGVETREELGFLGAELCDQAQGYLVGKPADIDGFRYLTRNAEGARGLEFPLPHGRDRVALKIVS